MKVPEIVEIELGEPWKLRENGAAIAIPLLLRKGAQRERSYRLISEVEDQVRLIDSGRIDRLQILNGSEEAVFIRKGSIVKGDTQTRAVTISVAVAPKSKSTAEIKCVYASKGIRGGTNFHFSDKLAPREVEESLRASQGETWSKVNEYTSNTLNRLVEFNLAQSAVNFSDIHSLVGTDDLEGYLGTQENIIDEAMKNIPADHMRQVGLVVVDINGISGLELFDHPDSWRALSKSVTRNYAEILAQMTSDIFDINLEKAKLRVEEYLKALHRFEGAKAYSEGIYTTYEFSDENIAGEFTTTDGTLIHILATRREKKNPQQLESNPQFNVIQRILSRTYDPRLNDEKTSHRGAFNINEVNPNNPQAPSQANPAATVDYLTKKRGYETIMALKEGPQSFNELQRNTGMSTATVTKAVREAESLHLIQRSYRADRGSTVYELTDSGKALKPEKFKATLEDD